LAALSVDGVGALNRPSHVAPDGSVAMVDVGAKTPSRRTARACALVRLPPRAAAALRQATLPKGDAFVTAQIAGILAAKRTGDLIPLCHPIPLDAVDVRFTWDDETVLRIEALATTSAKTGVEMEALVAASVAALTVYDMCKSVDKGIVVERVRLLEKTGGKSGDWHAE
jgi:cyclic pyranopterin phosphate synthase